VAMKQTIGQFAVLSALLTNPLAASPVISAVPAPKLQQSSAAENIRLNQLGFPPGAKKIAVILAVDDATGFSVVDAQTGKQVFTGKLQRADEKTWSGKSSWIAEFSRLSRPGNYYLEVAGAARSHPFRIQQEVYRDLAAASLTAFYFQRASSALGEEHAGIWARAAGHPDNQVQVHASAATASRPTGSLISASKGWYDAGDYNKYVVNSGITMGTLMSAFERFPQYFVAQALDIPEAGNGLPDILDEVQYNLDWLAAMQDPVDGGVYHKLTTASFEGMVAADQARAQRYVVQKTTAATLDFAAVMAQAARVYRPFQPAQSSQYLRAAQSAWQWAQENPDIRYRQSELNKHFDPDIGTGTYGDELLDDERIWAAAELLISTGDSRFGQVLENTDNQYLLPSWSQVKWLGLYSLLLHRDALQRVNSDSLDALEQQLLTAAAQLRTSSHSSPYRVAIGSDPHLFVWGSNAVAANQGILFIEAYRLSGDASFLRSAQDTLDYLLGRNATGYSFVTGFGHHTPQHPHHRLAAARPDLPPLPGFLVGGPNPGQQDDCEYPSDVADESYSDTQCSYASNEIAINWNAPLAYLANGLNALQENARDVD